MGLVSLFFIAVFSLLYISKGLQTKPDFVVRAVDVISKNVEMLSFVGLIYGFVALVLTPLMIMHGGFDLFVRGVVNILIILLALPYALNHIENKYAGSINPTIMGELRNFIAFVMRREKEVGYAGAVFALLLFAILFR